MKKYLVIILLSLILSGCSGDPLYVVEDAPIDIVVTEQPVDVTVNGTVSVEGEVVNISHDLDAIHEGVVFFTHDCTDLGNGESRDMLIITPVNVLSAHFRYNISSEAETSFYLYEDATTSANGTALNIWNRNRNSATTTELLFYHTPTITDDGILLQCNKVGSGKQVGGDFLDMDEIILKNNTKYIVRVTNDTVSDNWFVARFNWYEHEVH